MSMLGRQVVIFGAIGVLNTAVDIGSYLLLVSLGFPVVLAVIFSTSLGLVCSLFLNHRFTFGNRSGLAPRTIIKFLAVTLFGLWLIQPTIVVIINSRLDFVSLGGMALSKLMATAVSMIWNFCWYRWYVFVPKT